MKTIMVTTSINDGEYEEQTYIEAESVEQTPLNVLLVNGSVRITFGSPIIRVGPE